MSGELLTLPRRPAKITARWATFNAHRIGPRHETMRSRHDQHLCHLAAEESMQI
jgi:hypothetical protein